MINVQLLTLLMCLELVMELIIHTQVAEAFQMTSYTCKRYKAQLYSLIGTYASANFAAIAQIISVLMPSKHYDGQYQHQTERGLVQYINHTD